MLHTEEKGVYIREPGVTHGPIRKKKKNNLRDSSKLSSHPTVCANFNTAQMFL